MVAAPGRASFVGGVARRFANHAIPFGRAQRYPASPVADLAGSGFDGARISARPEPGRVREKWGSSHLAPLQHRQHDQQGGGEGEAGDVADVQDGQAQAGTAPAGAAEGGNTGTPTIFPSRRTGRGCKDRGLGRCASLSCESGPSRGSPPD